MLQSSFQRLSPVVLPHQGRQLYMGEINACAIRMPEGYDDYHEPVSRLLSDAGVVDGTVFMTVDEKIVKAGMSQRRPGPHVDGFFEKSKMRWIHGGGWNHYCNHLPVARMPVIVAASVEGCKAWAGNFEGEPKNDGDLTHLDLGEGQMLEANTGYLLSPDCIHESMIFEQDTQRSFLRLAFKAR